MLTLAMAISICDDAIMKQRLELLRAAQDSLKTKEH